MFRSIITRIRKDENFLFFWIYFWFWLADVVLVPYLGLFYVEKGLTGAQMSAISLVEAVVTPVAGVVISVLMTKATRKKMIFTSLSLGCALSALAMLFWGSFAGILIMVACMYFFRSPVNSIADGVIMDRLKDRPSSYAKYRMGGSVGYGIGAVIAGILSRQGCDILFYLYIPLMLVTMVLCAKAPMDGGVLSAKTVSERQGSEQGGRIRFDMKFVRIYGILTVMGMINAVHGKYMAIHITDQTGDSSKTGLLIAFAMVGEMIMFIYFPLIAKKMTPNVQYLLGFFLYLMRAAAVTFIASLPWVLVLFMHILGGAQFSLIWSAATSIVSDAYPGCGYIAQSLKSIFNMSVGTTIGLILLGFFYDRGQLFLGYGVLTGINLLCVMIFAVICLKERRERKIRGA